MTVSDEMMKSIWAFYSQSGLSLSEIAEKLNFDRKTVRKIVENEGKVAESKKKDSAMIEEELLKETFKRCDKRAERTHERLKKMGVIMGYSTLTKKIREWGLRSKKRKERIARGSSWGGVSARHIALHG